MSSYVPQPPTFTSLNDVAAYLIRELDVLAGIIESMTPYQIEQHRREPEKLKDWLIVAADGVSWEPIPGDGAGVYVYYAGAWHKAA